MRWLLVLLLGGVLGIAAGVFGTRVEPTRSLIEEVLPVPPVPPAGPATLPGLADGQVRFSTEALESVGLRSCFDGAGLAETRPDRPWLVRDIASSGTTDTSDLQAFPDLAAYPGLVKLEIIKSELGTEREHCGAARLSEHWFLTASHCVIGRGTELDVPPVDLVLVTPAHDLRTAGTQVVPVRGAVCHAAYRMNLLQWPNDVALLYVEDVSALGDVALAQLEPENPFLTASDVETAYISAWGSNGRNRYLQGGPVAISELGEAILITEALDGRGPNVGDSGSPLYALAGGSPVVVGVLSQVTDGEANGRRGVFVRAKSVLDWVNTAEAVCVGSGAYRC